MLATVPPSLMRASMPVSTARAGFDDLGFDFVAMASGCEVRVAGIGAKRARILARQAIDEVRRIEVKYSRYLHGSVVSRINTAAGSGEWVEVDTETTDLLDFAGRMHALSGGLFDATSGILRQAWDFKLGRLPEPGQIEALLPRIGWQHVAREGRRIRLTQPGMELDFGGFGKEYAADRAATLLQAHGVRYGMVNLGGDIRVVGGPPDGSPWRLGIQHPREADRLIAEIAVARGALATSGDYERHFIHEGVRYCHVLDPRTGWPVSHWQSVSVTAPACLAAGALTTIAMLKAEQALEFLDAQGVGYLAIDRDGGLFRRDLPLG
jgi:thiamine biosynthesis lipoprotein